MALRSFFLRSLVGFAVLAAVCSARTDHGLPGYGITFFDPYCATACRDSMSGATLSCSEVSPHDGMAGMDMGGMSMVETSADCYASDDAFLQTLAWCISSRCKDIPVWKLEKYWNLNVAGTADVQPKPKQSYQSALAEIDGRPTAEYSTTGLLNETSVVTRSLWWAAYNTDRVFAEQETRQEEYGLVILLSGVLIPVGFSLLRFLPIPGVWRSKFYAWLIDPPLWGTKHDTPVLFGLAQMPKRGQGLFIFYFIVINTVLSAVNYEYADPNTWYPDSRERWMEMLISNRLGLLSFANLPLVFLYAGRNNILLWITNWSHSTFLLLHRWLAAIATLQAIVHSLIYLAAYIEDGTHASESKLSYWYWGIVATLGMTILFPSSVLPLRRKFYELFLAWHVVISILVVAGCYWHILFEFQHQWGYETWIWVVMAIWGFDRAFRVLRLARNGIKHAQITVIDDEYARVTIPDVTASGHAYLYFPTLTWRVWENHPFSVTSTVIPHSTTARNQSFTAERRDIEKHPFSQSSPVIDLSENNSQAENTIRPSNQPLESGMSFYIRTRAGLTASIRERPSLPVLVEAGYHSQLPSSWHASPTLVVIAGGVGITAVLPYLRTHPGLAKLYWGCRSQGLVDDVRSTGALSGVEQQVFVGKRLAVHEILESELVRGKSEVCVLVSGPADMIDEVRNVVGEMVRKNRDVNVRLVVESFSW